jgi:hypothetical protein
VRYFKELQRTPRLAPLCAGVSPAINLASLSLSSAASFSGAFVATSGSDIMNFTVVVAIDLGD